jgi:hypothetical protein
MSDAVNHIAVDDPDTGIYRMIPLPDDLEDAVRSAHALVDSFLIPGLCEDEGFIKRFVVLYTVNGVAKATTVEAWDRAEAFEVLARAAEIGVVIIPPNESITA